MKGLCSHKNYELLTNYLINVHWATFARKKTFVGIWQKMTFFHCIIVPVINLRETKKAKKSKNKEKKQQPVHFEPTNRPEQALFFCRPSETSNCFKC